MAQDFATPNAQDAYSAVVSDLIASDAALRSSFAGASAPASNVAGQVFFDSDTGTLALHRAADTAPVAISGRLLVDTAAVGNVGGGEDDLISESLPAGTLSVDGDAIRIVAAGTFAANANNKTVKLYFGGTVLVSSGAVAVNNGNWRIEALVIRTGAATQKASASLACSDPATLAARSGYAAPTETLSGAVTIKVTGEGTADGDVTAELLHVSALI